MRIDSLDSMHLAYLTKGLVKLSSNFTEPLQAINANFCE